MVRLHGKMVKDLNRTQGFVDNVSMISIFQLL